MEDSIFAGDDIDFIADGIQKETHKAHTRKTGTVKKIKVRGSVEVARDDFRKSKKLHRQAIKNLKRQIKAHKLMIKQARGAYRLVKLR